MRVAVIYEQAGLFRGLDCEDRLPVKFRLCPIGTNDLISALEITHGEVVATIKKEHLCAV